MAKIRVNKLALELGLQNDQIIEALQKKKIAVKNHMSSVDEDAAKHIRDLFSPKTSSKAKPNEVKAKTKAKTRIKIKAPSKVKITTAKTQAKSTKLKKSEAKEEKPEKKIKVVKTSKTKATKAKKIEAKKKVETKPNIGSKMMIEEAKNSKIIQCAKWSDCNLIDEKQHRLKCKILLEKDFCFEIIKKTGNSIFFKNKLKKLRLKKKQKLK